MDNKDSSKLSLSPNLDVNLVLDCCVEKYKQPGIKNVFGNKNKKWLRLNLNSRTLSYRNDKVSTAAEKSFHLETVQRVVLDLSKDNRYYVQIYLQEKVIKFKFLEYQDWIRFTEAFTKISRTDTGEPLLKPSEKYLSMLIEYKEKAAISNGLAAKPEEIDLNMMPKKAPIDYGRKPPTEHVEVRDSSSDSSEGDADKKPASKTLKIKKPQPRLEAEERHTQHDKTPAPQVMKERVAPRRNESSEEEDDQGGRNAIIERRLNIG